MASRPSLLVRLPAELTLQILGLLTAKQVQRLRRVSRHFRHLLHGRDNLNTVSRAIETRVLIRLQDLVDTTFNTRCLDFLEAVAHFIEHRGFGAAIIDRSDELWDLARLWYVQHGGSGPPFPMSKGAVILHIREAAMAMLNVHFRHHLPQLYDDREVPEDHAGTLDDNEQLRLFMQPFNDPFCPITDGMMNCCSLGTGSSG